MTLFNDGRWGNGFVRKTGAAFGMQAPAVPTAPQTPDIHETTLFQSEDKRPPHERWMHSHMGYPQPHPAAMRHPQEAQDHLHKEEDKLYDEMASLTEKANQGLCTQQDLDRLKEVHQKLSGIQEQRQSAAKQILDNAVNHSVAQNAAAEPAREVSPIDPIPDSDATTDDDPPPAHEMPRQPSSIGWQEPLPGQRQVSNAVTEPGESSAPMSVPNGGGYSPDRVRTPRPVPLG